MLFSSTCGGATFIFSEVETVAGETGLAESSLRTVTIFLKTLSRVYEFIFESLSRISSSEGIA